MLERISEKPDCRPAIFTLVGAASGETYIIERGAETAHTRLAMIAEPSTGQLVAQGYEPDGPATRVLALH